MKPVFVGRRGGPISLQGHASLAADLAREQVEAMCEPALR